MSKTDARFFLKFSAVTLLIVANVGLSSAGHQELPLATFGCIALYVCYNAIWGE